MKIILLHGEYYLGAYKRLTKFVKVAKERSWGIENISNKGVLNLKELLVSQNLFEEERLFVIDGLANLSKSDYQWIKNNADNIEGNLVIVNTSKLSKNQINKFPKNILKIEEFKLPKTIFNFLDSLDPNKKRQIILDIENLINYYPIEFIFSMTAKHICDLYKAKIGCSFKYPSWRVSNLKKQSNRFSESQLKLLISELAMADIKAKTSRMSLKESLDLIMLTKLE